MQMYGWYVPFPSLAFRVYLILYFSLIHKMYTWHLFRSVSVALFAPSLSRFGINDALYLIYSIDIDTKRMCVAPLLVCMVVHFALHLQSAKGRDVCVCERACMSECVHAFVCHRVVEDIIKQQKQILNVSQRQRRRRQRRQRKKKKKEQEIIEPHIWSNCPLWMYSGSVRIWQKPR